MGGRLLAFLLLCLGAVSAPCAVRVEWSPDTRKFAAAGVYARVKPLRTGELLLIYSRGADACLRRSADRGATWGPEAVVARTEGYGNTNAELVELSNGWLVYGWNGRPSAGGRYTVRTRVSRDRGVTWGDEALAYSAGTAFGEGCWEPAFLESAGGDLQVYFANEGPYPGASGDQEIGMLTSKDRGLTWGGYRTVSYRRGARDGMPVPLRLQDGSILLAIEDNGLEGPFKPALLRSADGLDWPDGGLPGNSPRRSAALTGAAKPPAPVYAGAPYLARLASGEVLLSVQSTAGRAASAEPTDRAVMQVYAGDGKAGAFAAMPTPFPDVPETGNGLWNSLAVLDDSTVMAVSSVRGLGRDGIWTVIGRVKRDGVYTLGPMRPGPQGKAGPGWTADAAGRLFRLDPEDQRKVRRVAWGTPFRE